MNSKFFAVLVIVISVVISISLVYIDSTEEKNSEYSIYPDVSPQWCESNNMIYDKSQGCLNYHNYDTFLQKKTAIEKIELEGFDCRAIKKVTGMNKSYANDENETIAKQKLYDCGAELSNLEQIPCDEFNTKYLDDTLEEFDISNVEIRLNQCSDEDTKVVLENELNVSEKTEFPFYFSSDPLGNYEKWCIVSEGKYSVVDFESPILCMFDSLEKREKSKEYLREAKNTRIEDELAKRLCLSYKIDDSKCLDDIKINVEFDMETGYLLKDKKIDGVMYEFRIIESQDIQYRKSMLNPLDWKDVEIDG